MKFSLEQLKAKARRKLQQLQRYSWLGFICLVALLYALVYYRFTSLRNAEPSADAISRQVKATRAPQIEKSVVTKLYTLRDNSVNVQALFDEARNNPFD